MKLSEIVPDIGNAIAYYPGLARLIGINETLLAMAQAGTNMDPVTLRAALTDQGQFKKVGGERFLVELMESVPSAANAPHYAKIVLKAYKRRAARDLLRRGQDEMTGSGQGCEDRLYAYRMHAYAFPGQTLQLGVSLGGGREVRVKEVFYGFGASRWCGTFAATWGIASDGA